MVVAGADKPVSLPVQALDHATGYLLAAAVIHGLIQRRDHGQIIQAQLSLARTGGLLVSRGHDQNPRQAPSFRWVKDSGSGIPA